MLLYNCVTIHVSTKHCTLENDVWEMLFPVLLADCSLTEAWGSEMQQQPSLSWEIPYSPPQLQIPGLRCDPYFSIQQNCFFSVILAQVAAPVHFI